MNVNDRIDRKAVEKFFTWRSSRPTLIKLGLGAAVVGVLALAGGSPTLGSVALVISASTFVWAFNADGGFWKLYEELTRAKNKDFVTVLTRSFKKTETSLDSLVDFDPKDLISLDPQDASSSERDLVQSLAPKSVFLRGSRARAEHMQFLKIKDRIVLEYSPVHVSVLYLTRTDLIVYFANIDLTKGDLRVEEFNRLFLRDVVEITNASSTTRYQRAGNEQLFDKFEKAHKMNLQSELVVREHTIRITKKDGRSIDLPVGAPEYLDGARGTLDGDDDDGSRFSRVAREVFKRINDAKSAA
jgi:hypothetical protein